MSETPHLQLVGCGNNLLDDPIFSLDHQFRPEVTDPHALRQQPESMMRMFQKVNFIFKD